VGFRRLPASPRRGGRRRQIRRRHLIWLLVVVDLLLVTLACAVSQVRVEYADDRLVLGQWLDLDARGWTAATTGFRAPGQSDLPQVDEAFGGGPIQIGGRTFERGLGLYPFAEVVYPLNDAFDEFRATLGATLREWAPSGSVRVLLFGDGDLLYDSGPLTANRSVQEVAVGLEGVRELRVVAITVEREEPAYAYVAEPRLLRPLVAAEAASSPGRLALLRARQEQRAQQRQLEALDRHAAGETAIVRRWFAARGGSDAVAAGRLADGRLALATQDLAVVFHGSGPGSGQLDLLDLVHSRLAATGLRPAVTLPGGASRHLDLRTTDDPAPGLEPTLLAGLGTGYTLRVPVGTTEGDLSGTLALTLVEGSQAVLIQVETDRPVDSFQLLSADGSGGLLFGEELRYVTDFSRPREALVRDDGLDRPELVGQGAPVFLWSARPGLGLTLAVLDETDLPARFDVRREPGAVLAQVTVATGPLASEAGPEPTRSPRLYVEPTATTDPRQALAPFRALSEALYPAPPVPTWVRQQWGSWYVFGTAIDEQKIREFVDYVADYLGDLGPWHILLDAGWFIAEGRPNAELSRVDEEKFPSGIRALVDYAHARGSRVILYYSAPYVDTRPVVSEWLALPGFIDKYRDWLIPLGATPQQESFVYDFANPGLQAYMRGVLQRYFREWNADGILIDMLGHTEGAVLNITRPDRFGVVRPALGQSLDIYRFLFREARALRSDALLEGAWDTPVLARPYAHTWRYADDYPALRSAYPFGGLVEHVDYAVLQRLLLGQRPHMGAVIGQPDARINYWWLGAGLALGGQTVLSLPLTIIGPADLDDYRAYLTQARPFAGQTFLGAGLHPDTFATTVHGSTFLGVLNRQKAPRAIPVDFDELALEAGASYVAYDTETGRAFRAADGFVTPAPAESFRLFVLRREPGVLWTSSSFEPREGAGCLHLTLGGPSTVDGWLRAVTPPPNAVYLDGIPLPESLTGAESYHYDADVGVLAVRYRHEASRELHVECAR
jgi:hypothetical protein